MGKRLKRIHTRIRKWQLVSIKGFLWEMIADKDTQEGKLFFKINSLHNQALWERHCYHYLWGSGGKGRRAGWKVLSCSIKQFNKN